MFEHMFTSLVGCRLGRRSRSIVAALALLGALAVTATLLPTAAFAKSSIRVTIRAQNHHPIVKRKWTYSVTVTSARGQKMSGTETTHYLYGSTVVGTERPVNVRFKNGYYHDTLIFPAAAVGHPLRVWVVVRTRDGSGSAAWWIVVVKR
jgi:hypothetical protein